jgi:hypothetical protein
MIPKSRNYLCFLLPVSFKETGIQCSGEMLTGAQNNRTQLAMHISRVNEFSQIIQRRSTGGGGIGTGEIVGTVIGVLGIIVAIIGVLVTARTDWRLWPIRKVYLRSLILITRAKYTHYLLAIRIGRGLSYHHQYYHDHSRLDTELDGIGNSFLPADPASSGVQLSYRRLRPGLHRDPTLSHPQRQPCPTAASFSSYFFGSSRFWEPACFRVYKSRKTPEQSTDLAAWPNGWIRSAGCELKAENEVDYILL